MTQLGTRWEIDGVGAAFITRSAINGRYSVTFEKAVASLEAVESINWERPEIKRLTPNENEPGLPEGYGFDLKDLRYQHAMGTFIAELQTASQYLGDVTGYQEQISELETAAAEKDATIREQTAQIQELQAAGTAAQLEADLDAAYTEGVNSVE